MPAYTLDTVYDFVGQELGVSGWTTVDQPMIDAFAEVTGDRQWIHVDRERAARESPHGTTIAHGYLTLALLPALRAEVGVTPAGMGQAINYGLDRVRFLAPVRAGARVRARVTLQSAESKGKGVLLRTLNTVEIEGEEKPAVLAETLTLLLPEAAR
jgi:acyl dehydratase